MPQQLGETEHRAEHQGGVNDDGTEDRLGQIGLGLGDLGAEVSPDNGAFPVQIILADKLSACRVVSRRKISRAA